MNEEDIYAEEKRIVLNVVAAVLAAPMILFIWLRELFRALFEGPRGRSRES